MCCRRTRRHQPVVVTLGKYAYQKYQEKQAQKQALSVKTASQTPAGVHLSPQTFEDAMRGLTLEKQGIDPPSYNEVMVHRAAVPALPQVYLSDEKVADGLKYNDHDDDNLSDAESFYSTHDGERVLKPEMDIQASTFAEKWRARREAKRLQCQQENEACRTRCQEKKAARAARRAERRARDVCCS